MARAAVFLVVICTYFMGIQSMTISSDIQTLPLIIEEQQEESGAIETLPELIPEVEAVHPELVSINPCDACFQYMTALIEQLADSSVVEPSLPELVPVDPEVTLPEEEEEVVEEEEQIPEEEVVEEETPEEEVVEEETPEEEVVEEETPEEEVVEEQTPEEVVEEETPEEEITEEEQTPVEEEESAASGAVDIEDIQVLPAYIDN